MSLAVRFVVTLSVLCVALCWAERKNAEPDFSNLRKQRTFVVRQVNALEKETLVSRDGIRAMETAAKYGRSRRSTVHLRQITDGSTLLQLFYKDNVLMGCEKEQNPSVIETFLERFPEEGSVSKADALEGLKYEKLIDWMAMEKECSSMGKDYEPEHTEEEKLTRNRRATVIFPSTAWCGIGNRSREDGQAEVMFPEEDECCKKHDHCQHTIESFTRKYNYFNMRFHTISHCECDDEFRSCLIMANTEQANDLGRIYFNILRMKCFVFVRETVCAERNWYGKCIREKVQRTAELRNATPYRIGDAK